MEGNPFRWEGPVVADDFVDRDEVLARVRRDLEAGHHVILCAPRKMGKSSLIRELERRWSLEGKRPHLFAYIDLYGVTSRETFVEALLQKVVQAAPLNRRALEQVARRALRSVDYKFTVMKGLLTIELSPRQKDPDQVFEQTMDFPEAVAKSVSRRLVVALDEFQELSEFGGVALEKRLRAHFQHHRHVSYLFAGSQLHLLRLMFAEPERAFYRFGTMVDLGLIRPRDFAPFITTRFLRSGLRIDPEATKEVLRTTGGHPFFTQQLCYELWDLARYSGLLPKTGVVGPKHVAEALSRLLMRNSYEYESRWDSLRSSFQKRALIGAAREGSLSFGKDFIERYDLRSQSHVQKAKKALQERGLLEGDEMPDPFFRSWIKERFRWSK